MKYIETTAEFYKLNLKSIERELKDYIIELEKAFKRINQPTSPIKYHNPSFPKDIINKYLDLSSMFREDIYERRNTPINGLEKDYFYMYFSDYIIQPDFNERSIPVDLKEFVSEIKHVSTMGQLNPYEVKKVVSQCINTLLTIHSNLHLIKDAEKEVPRAGRTAKNAYLTFLFIVDTFIKSIYNYVITIEENMIIESVLITTGVLNEAHKTLSRQDAILSYATYDSLKNVLEHQVNYAIDVINGIRFKKDFVSNLNPDFSSELSRALNIMKERTDKFIETTWKYTIVNYVKIFTSLFAFIPGAGFYINMIFKMFVFIFLSSKDERYSGKVSNSFTGNKLKKEVNSQDLIYDLTNELDKMLYSKHERTITEREFKNIKEGLKITLQDCLKTCDRRMIKKFDDWKKNHKMASELQLEKLRTTYILVVLTTIDGLTDYISLLKRECEK